jgi:hypothetical protein
MVITSEEEKYILSRAYVPEHIVSLMVLISKGEPFFLSDHLCYRMDDWAILVGYPLGGLFSGKTFERLAQDLMKKFKCRRWSMIAPELPSSFLKTGTERASDHYYRLQLMEYRMKGPLGRLIRKGTANLRIERAAGMSGDHDRLIREFIERDRPADRIRELFLAMPEYAAASDSVLLLNARDHMDRLTAFYVVDLAARAFATYVVGCYSRENYVPYASDLLFAEMVAVAREQNKGYIHLGLGVNEGIRRFKEKWGGVPFLAYEFCEYYRGYSGILSLVRTLESKL